MPPATNPEFATWVIAKSDEGKVSGMLCPSCQAEEEPRATERACGS